MTTFDTNVSPIGFRMPRVPKPDFSFVADASRAIVTYFEKRRTYASVQHMNDHSLRDIGLDPADVRRFDPYRPVANPFAF